jgi:S1-C subfamily serine protease
MDVRRRTKAALFAAGGSVVVVGLLFHTGRVAKDSAGNVAATEPPGLQERIQEAARKTMPSVVEIGRPGSGVIVSADGLILTQHHVVSVFFPQATPGSKVTVRLAAGTEAEAGLLGVDPLYDLAALRLTGPGPYPHCPLAPDGPQLGDGILKLGHPVGGPTEGRPPVVRFCRVLARTDDQFICDCLVNGGDSGGPFVDLDGRVVGLQGPPGIAVNWPNPNQRAERLMVQQLDGRDHYLDTARAAPLLHRRLPLLARPTILPVTDADRDEKRADERALEAAPTLPIERWGQGSEALGRFRTAGTSGCVVEVLGWGDRVIALGTVVDNTGLVLTAAAPAVTETTCCPDKLRCRLSNGRVATATVVGVDPDYNLALIRVRADGLKPVEWAGGHDLAVGTFLAALGPNELPLVAGVVSVARRQVPHPRPVPTDHPSAAPLELSGQWVHGRGFCVESSEGSALDCGLRPNDISVSLGSVPIRSVQDLRASTIGRQASERMSARIMREGQIVDLALILPLDPRNRESFKWDFYPPVAFEGDLPILQNEHGCPVVGLDGKVVGVAVGRIAPQACLVVPADRVLERLADLKVGKPLAGLP